MDNTDRTDQLSVILEQLKSSNSYQQKEASNDLARLVLPLALGVATFQLRLYPWVANSSLLANEIASEACWSALKNIRELQAPEKLSVWLNTMVRWRLYYHLRRIPQYILTDELPEAPCSDEYSEESITSALHQAIGLLPSELYNIVILHYWQGYSVTDCAQKLGVNQPVVSRRLKRARNQIKCSLERWGYTKKEGV